MSFAYLHELLARQFGADFRQGGQLSVTFLKPVYDGDTVTAHGVVIGKDKIEHRTRFTLRVWLENQHGEKTSVGHAQVIIPSPLT
jgi:acyl dehydratase